MLSRLLCRVGKIALRGHSTPNGLGAILPTPSGFESGPRGQRRTNAVSDVKLSQGASAHPTRLFLALSLLAVSLAAPACAADKLRVGKAVAEAFSFVPLDVGMKAGIFQKNNVELETIAFAGDARMQQAMASDTLDIALGSGPAMAFIAKGSPVKAIAVLGNAPLLLTLVVRPDSAVNTVAGLNGRRVSVSTVGSLTYWLVGETSRQKGWGPEGIVITPMGATSPRSRHSNATTPTA